MDYQQHHYNGLANDWVNDHSSGSSSLASTSSTWDTSAHGVVGGMRNGAVSGLHGNVSSVLEYNGRDITAQLRDGTIHQLAPGTLVLGRFFVERALGKGGMSNVYLTHDQHFIHPNNFRSLKEMIGRLDEQNHLSNFEREANVLASLRHPRIPRVYDYFTIYHRAYLVLDFIEGKDLEAVLHARPDVVPPEEVVDWMLQLCDIVEYLHTQPTPIIFRDLKPNNIILTPDGHVVLIDFGIAKLLQQTGAIDTNVGTQGYAAQEMYEGRAEPRSDIFALGAMMHHLLSKTDPRTRAPFTFHQHPIRHYNPAVSAELESVVMKCVEQQIDKRYQSIYQLRQALEEAIGYSALQSTHLSRRVTPSGGIPGQTRSRAMGALGASASLLWRYQTENEVRATPAVSQDTVFIGSYDNNLHAINRSTGTLRWKFPTEGGICVTPALSRSSVIFGSQDFNVYSVNQSIGKEEWRYRTWNRVHSSPRIFENRLYIGSDDMYIHAVEPATGIMIWRYQAYREIWSSAAYDNGTVFIGSSDSSVYAVDALTGEHKWRFRAQAEVISSPAVMDGYVYFGSKDYAVYAVDVKSGWQAWRTPTEGHVISSPLIVDDQLFIGSTDNHLYCLDRRTGKIVWKYATGGQVNSSPAYEGGALYFGSSDHNVYSLDLQGKLRWRYATAGIVPGSPSIRDGIVYIGSADGCVYALRADG
jgi:eukaryotic-like serine/threonine-protein kinase